MIKLNGVEIKPTIFPDGTSQVWKIPEEVFQLREHVEQDIQWDFENEAEFIHLAQLCDLLLPLFENGKLLRETTLAEIRGRLNGN